MCFELNGPITHQAPRSLWIKIVELRRPFSPCIIWDAVPTYLDTLVSLRRHHKLQISSLVSCLLRVCGEAISTPIKGPTSIRVPRALPGISSSRLHGPSSGPPSDGSTPQPCKSRRGDDEQFLVQLFTRLHLVTVSLEKLSLTHGLADVGSHRFVTRAHDGTSWMAARANNASKGESVIAWIVA